TSNTYSISSVSGATSYTWSVPSGATIVSGQGTTSITVDYGATSGDVSVTATNSCGTSSASTLAITLNEAPATPGAITGISSQCPGATAQGYSISSVSGATSYTWSVPAGWTITSGQNTTGIQVTVGSFGDNGDISVAASNGCGTSASAIIAVTVNSSAPSAPLSITTPSIQCSGSSGNIYSISAVSGATSYNWTITGVGWSIQNGQGTTAITVQIGSGTGTIAVSSLNACGSSVATSTGVIVPGVAPSAPVGIITPAIQCSGSTGNTYSIAAVPEASNYTWAVSGTGWSIQSGQGSTSIQVNIGSGPGSVSVSATNNCGTSPLISTGSITPSTAPLAATTIIQPTSICSGSTGNIFSVGAVVGATSYTWSVTGTGWSISSGQGTSSVTITIGSGTGTVSVTPSNACGTGPSTSTGTLTPNTIPASPSSILLPANLCAISTSNIFSVAPVSGATNYTWSTSGAGWAVTGGQGTTSALVSIGSSNGNVIVVASNSCGVSAPTISSSLVPNVAPVSPSLINTPANQCAGTTGNVYSISPVSGATTYVWSVTGTGWSITSGQGTTSVQITIGNSPGSVSVSAVNACGSSASISSGTIDPSVAATPSSIAGSSSVCESVSGLTYSITAQPNTQSYIWSVPTGWTITSGQGTTSITVTSGLLSQNGPITVSSVNSCSTSAPSTLTVSVSSGVPTTPVISGLATICSSSNGESYSVTNPEPGTSYTWFIPSSAMILLGGSPQNSATIDFGNSSGTISVMASNSCGNSALGQLNVTVNYPFANVLSYAGDICSGETAYYTLSGNIGDVLTYSINGSNQTDLTITSSPYAITVNNAQVNQTLNLISVATPGTGCFTTYNNNYTVIVHPHTVADVSISSSQTTICQGSSVQFNAISSNGNSIPTYQWQINGLNVGTNSPVFTSSTLNNGDVISVILSLTGGFCLDDNLDTSNAVLITVTPLPSAPGISVLNECNNSVLTANGYSGSLTWNTNETTPSISVQSAGSYSVYQTVNGCNSPSFSVSAAPYGSPSVQLGNDTTICLGSSIVLDASNPGSSYIWSSSGVTDQFYSFTGDVIGDQLISVQITDQNGCSGSDAILVSVQSCASIEDNNLEETLSIYPNPSNGIFYLTYNESLVIEKIEVYSEEGKVIQTLPIVVSDEIDLRLSARGVYFVKVVTNNFEAIRRVIIN
ncbi:MAG: T9SS type A sorting domain-containing protein, partial [Cryomorphaceae bacterium]|nr:T9SS type A sorting domain-containing protein [Cryomorphaceae bacterium]